MRTRFLALMFVTLIPVFSAQATFVISYRGTYDFEYSNPANTDLVGMDGATFLLQGKLNENANRIYSNNVNLDGFAVTMSLTISGSVSNDGTYTYRNPWLGELSPSTVSADDAYWFLGGFTIAGIDFDPGNIKVPHDFTGAISSTNKITPFNTSDVTRFDSWSADFYDGSVSSYADYGVINAEIVSVIDGADLTGADLSDLNLAGVALTNATLTGVSSGGISGAPSSLPVDWQLSSGYLVGPGADLTGADLNGADLTGADLNGADLSGTVLTNATLVGVSYGGIIGTPASLPFGWQVTNGYLVAELATNDVPHWWLVSYGFTSDFDAAALGSHDEDSLLTWEEYFTGTDPTDTDSDNDLVDDGMEIVLADLGFINGNVDSNRLTQIQDNSQVLGVFTTNEMVAAIAQGEANVTNAPNAFGLYTPVALLDLDVGDIGVEITNGMAELSLELWQSDDLTTWTNVGGTVYWAEPVDADKKFFRVRAEP